MRQTILLVVLLFLGAGYAQGQSRVTGKVVDSEGNPISFATVAVKGATHGTTTAENGTYSINVDAKATLVFAFIGFETQEHAVNGREVINVTMKPEASTLDEVLVVAYGTSTKSSFTGSASVIKKDILEKRQTSSVTKALDGAVSGVQVTSGNGQPGMNATVRIRGIGSVNASSSPLYVVDGMPFEGNMNTINNSDIESMTVLKDAAANSLYGARGANGVILITTKKGKNGEAKVTFDARVGQNSRAVGNYDVFTEARDFYNVYFDAARNKRFFAASNKDSYADVTAWMATNIFKDGAYNLGLVTGKKKVYNSFEVPTDQLFDPKTGMVVDNAKLLYQDDWSAEMFDNRGREEYNLSVSGGDTRRTYFISLGYLNDRGIVPASSFKRYNSRVNIEQEVNSWLKTGGNMSYVNTDMAYQDLEETSGANMFYLTNNMAPIYTIWERDEKGNIMYNERGQRIYSFDRPFSGNTNAIASQELDKTTIQVAMTSAKGFAEVKFLEDFKFRFNLGVDNGATKLSSYNNHLYGQFADKNGLLYKYRGDMMAINTNQLLTWTRRFGSHNIDVLVGHESYRLTTSSLSGSKNNFLTPGLSYELDDAIANPQIGSSRDEYTTEGFLSRAQYNFDEKYFLSASIRRDGSSVFHPDHRWGNFWSIGGAWNLNKEGFMSELDWIQLVKLKSSYGSQGNDAIFYPNTAVRNYYAYKDQFNVVNSAGQPSLERYYTANRELRWESNYNFNIGVEFDLFDKKLNGGIEYFQRTAKDLLFNVPIPVSSGQSTESRNVGNMRNKGIEVELSSNFIKTNDLDVNVSLNMTHYTNEILKLAPVNQEKGIMTGVRRMAEGLSYYNLYMLKYAGVNPETGASRWYVKDQATGDIAVNDKGEKETTETYDSENRFDLGSALPDFFGGFNLDISYKGFDLSVLTSFQVGGKIADYQYFHLMSNSGTNNWHKDMLDRWTPENPSSDIPRVKLGDDATDVISDRFIISSSFFNINNITLGYNLPSNLVKKAHLSSVRVYGAMDNVALFSKRKGFDPRTVTAGANQSSTYSPLRVVSMGINLTF